MLQQWQCEHGHRDYQYVDPAFVAALGRCDRTITGVGHFGAAALAISREPRNSR